MMRSTFFIAGLVACAKPTTQVVDFDLSLPVVQENTESHSPRVEVTQEILQAGAIVVDDGISFPILQGWTAQEGASGSARVATFHHQDSRLVVEVWKYPREVDVEPRPQAGCDWLFVDGGSYQNLATLGAATVGTCVPERASEPTRQVWIAMLGEYQWHVEARFSPGTLVSARETAESFLRSIHPVE